MDGLFIKTNSVEEWFYQAYKFNQEVYGKYVNFSGIFKTVIAPFFGYGSMIWKAIQQLTVSLYSSVIILVYVVVNILFLHRNESKRENIWNTYVCYHYSNGK